MSMALLQPALASIGIMVFVFLLPGALALLSLQLSASLSEQHKY